MFSHRRHHTPLLTFPGRRYTPSTPSYAGKGVVLILEFKSPSPEIGGGSERSERGGEMG